MLFSDITYINADFTPMHHAYVGTTGAKITYLAETPPPNPAEFGRLYPGQGKLLVNGFYNAHSHAAMGLLRGYGESLTLQDWLHKRIFPFEAQLTPDDIYWGTLLCAVEMLRYGIVSTSDMYFSGAAMAQAFLDSGIKANLAIGTSCFDQRTYLELPQYHETLDLIERFHNHNDGQLQIDFCMHAEYTSQEPMVRSLAATAKEYGLRMQVHVSETATEVAECQSRHQGKSPVAYLADCGIFDQPTTAAHCVHISDADIAILKEYEVSVASCPKSNLKLASGVCPAEKLLAAGVNVALGTDSVASNNNLNMVEEMRLFALLHKGISGDPTLITPAQALAIATKNGALSQGRSDCGSIQLGNRADLVVLDTTQPHMHPQHNLLNNLVYAASGDDIALTMVDGQIRYEDGSWPGLAVEEIYAQVEQSRLRILAAL